MDWKEMSHAQLVEQAIAHEKYIDELRGSLIYKTSLVYRYRETLKAVLHAILRQTASRMTHGERNRAIRGICAEGWRIVDTYKSGDIVPPDLDELPF